MPTLRFLHASDFHLEQPPRGLAEIPDHLRQPLTEAPFRAAQKVFDAAISHSVDFVVLAGDLVASRRSGPRGILFLRDQFVRLSRHGIDVYWAGGRVDRTHEWPAAIDWPSNVHIFAPDGPTIFTVNKRGVSVCEIIGQSLSPDGPIDFGAFDRACPVDRNGFMIGVAHDDSEREQPRNQQIDYWALGGLHEPTLPDQSRPLVHFPGSPQGRSPSEFGPHGCTVVQVTEEGEIRTSPMVTDVVRYCQEQVAVAPLNWPSAANHLESLLRERMKLLTDANPDVMLLVRFALTTDRPITVGERSALPLSAIAGVLRGEFGYRSSPVWLDQIQWPSPQVVAESWFEHETLLGDFLRAARRQERTNDPIPLDCYLPTGKWAMPTREALGIDDLDTIRQATAEAASLGASLLCSEAGQ